MTNETLLKNAMGLAAKYMYYAKDNFGITIYPPKIEQHVEDEYLLSWDWPFITDRKIGVHVYDGAILEVIPSIAERLKIFKID